jgi:formylglycine-generating enzyme required for sulfatase activity
MVLGQHKANTSASKYCPSHKNPENTEPVTSYSLGRSPEGVYNLVGNVWEWTASYFDGYSDSDEKKHVWDGQIKTLIWDKPLTIRGGNWKNPMPRITYRVASVSESTSDTFGIRCAKSK